MKYILIRSFVTLIGVSCPDHDWLLTLTWFKTLAKVSQAKTSPNINKKKLNVCNMKLFPLLWNNCPESWMHPSLLNPSSKSIWLKGKFLTILQGILKDKPFWSENLIFTLRQSIKNFITKGIGVIHKGFLGRFLRFRYCYAIKWLEWEKIRCR